MDSVGSTSDAAALRLSMSAWVTYRCGELPRLATPSRRPDWCRRVESADENGIDQAGGEVAIDRSKTFVGQVALPLLVR